MILRWGSRGVRALTIAGVVTTLTVVSAAGAAPANVDVALHLGATIVGTSGAPPLVPSGATVNVTRRNFFVHVDVSLITPAPGGRPKVRAALGGGLRWGADDPDPTEGCTSTSTTADCQSLVDLQPIPGQSGGGWFWDVVAPANGTYTFSAELYDLAQPDPVPSDNASTITIVVNEESSGSGGSGGSGGGSGSGATAVSAGAAKLSSSKPKAGSIVVASVRVTRGGSAIRPSGVRCSGSIGSSKIAGTPRAASGLASCSFKTPRTAKGKSLAGSISLRAGGERFTRRFTVRLG